MAGFPSGPRQHRADAPLAWYVTALHSEEIARCLPPRLVRFERFPDCGHGVFADVPERAFAVLREFIAAEG